MVLLEGLDRQADAADHYKALAKADPRAIEPWKRYARALKALSRSDEAAKAWRRVVEIDDQDVEAHAALAELVGDRAAAAIPHLRVLAERGPDLAGARRRLAQTLEKWGDKAEVRQAFVGLIEVAPDDVMAHERLAQLLAEEGDAAGALLHLRWLAENAQGKDKPWRRLAQALKDQGDAAGEIEAWGQVLALLPQDPQAHERIATLLEGMGRAAEAVAHLEAAAETDPSKIKAWKRYARALEATGGGAEAFKVWRRVLELDPADPHAHDRLAELLLAQGLKARALAHVRVLAESGEDRASWRRMGRLLAELGRTDEATLAWRKVLEIAPAEQEAHGALAELLQDQPAEAALHLRALAEATPKKPEVWRGLGRALAALGDADGAMDAWRRLLKLEEDDIEAHAALADLIGEGKVAALPHLEVLAARGPDLAGARRRLGRLQEKTGDLAAAQKTWESLILVAPGDPLPHERLAQLLAGQGDKAAALGELRWLTTHGPDPERAFRRLAQALKEQGDAEGEIDAWRGLLAGAPADGPAHERLAVLLGGLGRKAEGAAHLKALAELQPQLPKPWKRHAKAVEEAGDAEGALAAWRQVLLADAEDPHAHDELGRIQLSLGRHAEAGAHLRAGAEGDPANLRRWKRLAAVFQEAKDAEGEADAWRRVLGLEAADALAHERLAQLLEIRGDRAEAAVHVRALAESDPSRPRPWRRLARLYDEAGDLTGALDAWTHVSELEPNDLAAREHLAQLLLDLERPAEAALHLQLLVGSEPGKSKGWRRLALALQQAGQAEAETQAWGHVLAAEPDDLQAHERLAHLLADAGQEAEALPHLQAAVRLAPENARAWRRYARALGRSDKDLDALGAWRQTLALAGQGELEGQLKRTEEAIGRIGDLEQDLQAAGAELKRERGAAQHAANRFEREERAHRATQGLLKDELAERRRLTAELQESGQRRRQAEAEESSHLLAGRLLGLLEPLAVADQGAPGQGDEAAAYVEESLRAAVAAGAMTVAQEADARLSGAEPITPEALQTRLRGRSSRLVILADSDPRARAAIRAELAGKRGLTVLDLDQLAIRRAAGIGDLKTRVEPVSDDIWPPRPVMIMSADDALRSAVAQAIGKATALAFAPLFPAALAARVRARELDLDDWLAAVWSAHRRPRLFGFQFDPETLALFAREIRSGRAQVMAKVFRRATALELAWSDKALFAAADHFARSGEVAADFDAGDAQIEVKTYKRLVARDMLLENASAQLGKFRPATVKAYRELFDKPALGRFCRDAGLSLAVAGFAEVDERALGFMPPPELVRAGALIGEAVTSLTATRDPEAPPQGLMQYGLGRSLEALGRHAEALEAYQEAVVRAPTYFPARAAAARYLELAGRPDDAERLLRQGLGNGTPDPDVQEGLLDFYQRNASPLGVAATSRLMKKKLGQSRPAIAAPALIELGRWRDADPLLKALAPRIAGQDTFLNDLVALPDLAARLEDLRAEAGADGSGAAAQLRLAEALRRLGRLPQSLEWYRRALAEPGVLEAETGVGAEFRPQFLMVGPPRTGTTLLRRLFDLHPQIAAPSGELFFFSSRTGQRAGSNRQRAPLAWYLEAFKAAAERKPEARVIGEKTPHYFSTSNEQMALASTLLPQVKIIATLRDPVVRAWSEIKVQRRVTEAEIVAALGEDRRPNWLAETIDAGRFVGHLKRWLRHVTPDQLLLVDADALETHVVEEAGRIFRWLGVRELSRRQVESLQQGWNNRTESFSPNAAVEALLRRSYEGEPWTAAEVGKALGLGEAGAQAKAPTPARAARRRTTAK
ncbi:MAG TPA: tetratricopeptide repeat protein [Caulobacteraceae bacterium]